MTRDDVVAWQEAVPRIYVSPEMRRFPRRGDEGRPPTGRNLRSVSPRSTLLLARACQARSSRAGASSPSRTRRCSPGRARAPVLTSDPPWGAIRRPLPRARPGAGLSAPPPRAPSDEDAPPPPPRRVPLRSCSSSCPGGRRGDGALLRRQGGRGDGSGSRRSALAVVLALALTLVRILVKVRELRQLRTAGTTAPALAIAADRHVRCSPGAGRRPRSPPW